MGKLIVEEIISADGFAADRNRAISFMGGDPPDRAANDHQLAMLATVDAILLGRKTYEMFAEFWPTSTEAIAGPINALPKHVVTTSLARAPWGGGEAIVEPGDAVETVTRLKAQYRGNLVLWGSMELAAPLFRAKLVDRLRLRIVPVLIGNGIPVAPDDLVQTTLRLVEATPMASGHITLTYDLA